MKKLRIRPRKLVRGVFSGSFRSALRAPRGVDIVEFQDFNPNAHSIGDIDIRASIRRQKWVVKIVDAEKNPAGLFLFDNSESFDISTQELSKKNIGIAFADMIARSMMEKGASIGAVCFSEKVDQFFQPRFGKKLINSLVDQMEESGSNSRTSMLSPALEFTITEKRVKRPSMVFIITDGFFHQADGYKLQLSLVKKHHDIIVMIIRDPIDIGIPPVKCGYVSFEDSENENLAIGKGMHTDNRLAHICDQLGIANETFVTIDSMERQIEKLATLFARHAQRRKE